ncbi:MAG: s-methyl-5-thioribose-1-phosphate isomerase [Chloroflexaceae bacterium]|nr:s-methyl-5-thioribose-1-phosphate isomerase [Chloroflexaceae bacterium]
MLQTTLPLLTRRGDTIRYDREHGVVLVLDRRCYPHDTVFVRCSDLDAVATAITDMIVQGGPPLAYVAGYGLALVARLSAHERRETQRAALQHAATLLRATRPTADDLHAVVGHALHVAETALAQGMPAETAIADGVDAQVARGDTVAERCGRHAAHLIPDGAAILTHCFAGAALNWMLYTAACEQGKTIQLYPTETRPYLQGARLTSHQAQQLGLKVTLLTDNMPGHCFQRGLFQVYVTAADRIAMDGSIANKVGTYQYAVLAARHQVPFYVLGYDGPDPATPDAAAIPIEERNPSEVLMCAGVRTAPEGIGAFYPAFDVTPSELITAISTDQGVFAPADIYTYDQHAP